MQSPLTDKWLGNNSAASSWHRSQDLVSFGYWPLFPTMSKSQVPNRNSRRGRGSDAPLVAVSIPRIQHALEDPEAWNSQWELFLQHITPQRWAEEYVKTAYALEFTVQKISHSFQLLYTSTTSLLHRVGARCLEALLRNDFENKLGFRRGDSMLSGLCQKHIPWLRTSTNLVSRLAIF